MAGDSGSHSSPLLTPGQTLIFLGDHTSPDSPGYVALVREVAARFHPELALRLISAGSRGQSASGLRSKELMDVLSSARPDWLVIGIGLADALREPVARELLEAARLLERKADQGHLDVTFGPEMELHSSDSSTSVALLLQGLEAFADSLREAISTLQGAGVNVCLLTTILLGNRFDHPLNRVVVEYNHVIREEALAAGALLVDIETAFRDVMERAANYRQKVSLTNTQGELNAQGQALVARQLLAAFGVLPSGRMRGR
jgi:hypothetical protein